MTQWSRKIGRQVTNAVPAWVTTITQANGGTFPANRLFAFGETPGTAAAKMVWPNGTTGLAGLIPGMDGGTDGTPEMQHRGWGSAWYVPDVGAHGTFVYGRTGEFTYENQRSMLQISQDTPTWDWWQQPFCCLNATDAATEDADWYYNVADYNAGAGLARDTLIAGWVLRRKVTNGTFGRNVIARNRYHFHTCIPASWTGTGAAALVCNPMTHGGPSQQIAPIPNGVPGDSTYVNELWPSGVKKYYLQFENSLTKVRTFATTPNQITDPYAVNWPHQVILKDSATKRLYWIVSSSSQGWGRYYADFTAGIAGVTMGSYAPMSYIGGFASDFVFNGSRAACFTSDSTNGQRVGYAWALGQSTYILVFNLATDQWGAVDLGARGLSWGGGGDKIGMTYVAATNTVYIVEHSGTSYWLHRFTVPSTPFTASAYSVTRTALTVDSGATVDSSAAMYMHGDKCTVIDSLGGLIILPQYSSRPLAFRPS